MTGFNAFVTFIVDGRESPMRWSPNTGERGVGCSQVSDHTLQLPRSMILLGAHVSGPGISIYAQGTATNYVFPALTQGYMLV